MLSEKTVRIISIILCISLIICSSGTLIAAAEDLSVYDGYYFEEFTPKNEVVITDGEYYIYNLESLNKLNKAKYRNVHICTSEISENINITNKKIRRICFDDCVIKSKSISLPDSVVEIEINHSEFSNYDFLGKVANLDNLRLNNIDSLKDLKPYSSARNITTIRVNNCKNIKSLNGIEAFKNVDYVDVSSCGVNSLEPLKTLKKIDTLILADTAVEDLSPIKNAPMKRLYITDSINIRNFDIVTGFKNLEILYAGNLEMAYTQKVIDFVKKNHIESNITSEGHKIQKEVKAIAKKILKGNMTVQQKVEAIVKYVLENITYDTSVPISENSPELLEYNDHGLAHALKGKGVCRNYVSLSTALMYEAGFKSYEVSDDAHIWNLIKIEDYYFWLDTTWLDEEYLNNFTKSDYYMSSSHEFCYSHDGVPIPCDYKLSPKSFSSIKFKADMPKSSTVNNNNVSAAKKTEKGKSHCKKSERKNEKIRSRRRIF